MSQRRRVSWWGGATRLLSALLITGLLSSVLAQSSEALGLPILISITVSPAVGSIGAGQTEQFTATGIYADLSTKNLTDSVTWATSKKATATVSSQGLATADATGAVTITAADASTKISGTAALTVTPAVLVAIVVSPPVGSIGAGQTEQFTATGTNSNLTTQNLTDSVTWSSSEAGTATVSSTGLATGVANGVVTITATDPATDIPGTAALTVIPAVLVAIVVSPPVGSIGAGQTEQFTATGTYSDLSTQNLTDSVTWSSSEAGTATVSSTGLATGVANGVVTITATDPATDIPGTAALTVLPAVLVAIVVSPPVGSIAAGQTEQFTATGTYSDLSTQNLTDSVTWSSSEAGTATVSSTGLATGVANGVVTITATDSSTDIPGTAALTLLPAVLVAITVTPPVGVIGIGRTEQFTATGLYSNLSTQNLTDSVTWSSSNTATGTVSATGLATGVAAGAATVTATDTSTEIPGTAVLTVGVSLTALTMTPSTGAKRTPVSFSGVGFTPGKMVTVTYMSGKKRPKKAKTVLCTAIVTIDGTFSCPAMIPRRGKGGALGQKSIVAIDSGGAQATATFTLT